MPAKFVKDIRAILHIWQKYGYDAAYASFYPHYKSEKCQLYRGEPNLVNIISGKLCYLKMIKGENDPVYAKLHSQFLRLKERIESTRSKENIEYLFTMPKTDFENKLGVNIEFRERVDDKKTYGCFHFQERFFVIAVSKNIDINNLPKNAQISLTKTRLKNDSQKIGYLLHKSLCGYHNNNAYDENTEELLDELKELVVKLSGSQLKNDFKIVETYSKEDLLTRLVDSDFDLSILP